jgi:hypothetical protein
LPDKIVGSLIFTGRSLDAPSPGTDEQGNDLVYLKVPRRSNYSAATNYTPLF